MFLIKLIQNPEDMFLLVVEKQQQTVIILDELKIILLALLLLNIEQQLLDPLHQHLLPRIPV
jgi:hypothetical protein